MRKLYETSIRIAAALGDENLLASSYHNYANDLYSTGDTAGASRMLPRVRELAEHLNWSELEEKTRRLADLLATPPDAVEG